MRRNFRGLLEAARPQAMATERDMLFAPGSRAAGGSDLRWLPSTISPP